MQLKVPFMWAYEYVPCMYFLIENQMLGRGVVIVLVVVVVVIETQADLQ